MFPNLIATPSVAASSPLNGAKAAEPTNPSASSDVVQRNKQAAAILGQANDTIRGLRKTLAVRRMQRVQAILKALVLFGGQPGSVVRQASDLVRELAGAVQDYKAAGGRNPSTLSVSAADSNAADTTDAGMTGIASGSDQSGFVSQAQGVLQQLQIVVDRQRNEAVRRGNVGALHEFDAVAKGTATIIDQTGAASPINVLI